MMVLVWTRPRFSLGGMRCQRWPPASPSKVSTALLPEILRTQRPGRCSTTSKSKTPPGPQLEVDGDLLVHEELGVVAAFGSPDLYDEAVTHDVLVADRARMVESDVERA